MIVINKKRSNTECAFQVDHHVLCGPDKHLAPLVAEVIDHRPLEVTFTGRFTLLN